MGPMSCATAPGAFGNPIGSFQPGVGAVVLKIPQLPEPPSVPVQSAERAIEFIDPNKPKANAIFETSCDRLMNFALTSRTSQKETQEKNKFCDTITPTNPHYNLGILPFDRRDHDQPHPLKKL